MSRQDRIPADHPAFADLPARMLTLDRGDAAMAVYVAGRLGGDRPPLVCIPGYHRNMSDYSAFLRQCSLRLPADWPVVLLDLRGRGRSTDRAKHDYASPADALDLTILANALGIERAVFIGQGYGGQVTMALASLRPSLIAGAVLIDAGPVSDPRGLVRLRVNLRHIAALRGDATIRAGLRQILANDYPGTAEGELDKLALRTHFIGRRGRAHGLFDPQLLLMLDSFEHDDVLVAQWPLFDALAGAPLLLFRSQFTDQLRRETFDEMIRRRPEAEALVIAGQGSPALLDHAEEVDAIAGFLASLAPQRRLAS
ncbi:MAG TPA: alpha/beta fold hydrolase [Devosiaceae bacterium]|jgi:pimeloyl-ACP methyl ester carboxylesterase